MKKIIKMLCMDWYVKFQCIGGSCPITCCSSEWKIVLTEEEIEKYKNMEHPFQSEIMKWVDEEKKCMLTDTREGKCGLLTEDGWCRMVLECGEEYLSKTCTLFPRNIRKYGDILEADVEIVCPVVAGYLLENIPIGFVIQEKETDNKIKEIDYQIYDSLALARSELVEMTQSFSGDFITGKLYIILSVLNKLKELFSENQLNKNAVSSVLGTYAAEKIRNEIFMQSEVIMARYSQKAIILQGLLLAFQSVIGHLEDLVLKDEKFKENITLWLTDKEKFARDLEDFSNYLKQDYPLVSENFLTYVLFKDWIEFDKDRFGKKIVARIFELSLIQIIAMSVWAADETLSREKYQVVIASVDRIFSHKKDFLYSVSKDLNKMKRDTISSVLMFLI